MSKAITNFSEYAFDWICDLLEPDSHSRLNIIRFKFFLPVASVGLQGEGEYGMHPLCDLKLYKISRITNA